MKTIQQAYRTLNLLSLDVVAGAVLSALFFCRIFQATPRWAGFLALALTVWVIYTVDRLLDLKKNPTDTLGRHQFHRKYYRSLWASCLIIALVLIVLIFFLRLPVLKGGLVLSVVVMVYILVQKQLRFVKEVVVALFYTCGVVLLSWSLKTQAGAEDYLIVIPFFIIALINLILFSWFEWEADETNRQNSFVTHFGKSTSYNVLAVLFAAGIIAIVPVVWTTHYAAAGVYFFMLLVLFLIYWFPSYFSIQERYRLWGDAVFLLPGLALWI